MNGSKDTMNCVKGTSTLVRPKFGPGMLLQHEDLEQLSTYTRELSRLLFRSFFGCGVVCGLEVAPARVCGKSGISVSPGLALDCSGDPVYLPAERSLEIEKDCEETPHQTLWVILCRTEKCCSPRPSMCASDEDETPSVCTRERDGFEICIVSDLRKCSCRCEQPPSNYIYPDNACKCADPNHPCYEDHYDGKCGCYAGEGCDCSCGCILLAQLNRPHEEGKPWAVDHNVRRFIRPVLMRDPLWKDKTYDEPHGEEPETARAAPPAPPPATKPSPPAPPAAVAEAAAPATPPPETAAPAAEATASPAAAADGEAEEQTKKSPRAAKPKPQA
jgi:hypothetical protein